MGEILNYTELNADLVIVGGGGAGLAAAVAASEKGIKVILFEKHGLGGNSALAFGIFAAESPVQNRQNIICSCENCFKVAMDWSHWRLNPILVRALIDKSGDTVKWLEDMGVEFECGSFGTDQLPVFHKPNGRGAALVKVLIKRGKDLGVQNYIHCAVRRILTGNGRVIGVVAEKRGTEIKVLAKNVIIATGGYGGNIELLKKYSPDYHEGMERVGLPHNGDGLTMAMEAGAATEGLGNMLLGMPSAFHPSDLNVKQESAPRLSQIGLISIAEDPRTLRVNKNGQRFTDEDFNNDSLVSANANVRQPGNICYTIWDSKITDLISRKGPVHAVGLPHNGGDNCVPGLEKDLYIQAQKGQVKIVDTLEDLSTWIGIDSNILAATISKYNGDCEQKKDTLFAKNPEYFQPISSPPYYALKWYTSFINTIGGIKINEHMQVLDCNDDPIPGLYAAGVDTGGWESSTYCMRLPGHLFGFALNSGRIAGENCAKANND